MKKILWLANIPSPYRVDFFNELGRYCDLTVLFERRTSTERDKSWEQYKFENFKGVFLKGIAMGVAEAWCPQVVSLIKKNEYDFIIVTNFSDLTGITAILKLKQNKIPYIIESDGGFAGTGLGLKEKLKKFVLSGAQMYFSTAKEHDNYYTTYGAPVEKIVRYPFTSMKEENILKNTVSKQNKLQIRQEIGIVESNVIVAVGQFINRKGFDVLLQAAKSLPENLGIYFIGGEPTKEYLDYVEQNKLSQVHFVGFKNHEELTKYYQGADMFVLPTREDIWGLVVNEAMGNGLPVITTQRCIAGVEMVVEGKNGFIIPVDDAIALNKAVVKVLQMPNMPQEALKTATNYTIENMVKAHINALNITV